MTKIKRIWKSVKDFCIAIDPFIVSFFIILLLAIALSGCVRDVNLDSKLEQKVVVECVLTTDEVQTVYLSLTNRPGEAGDNFLQNAEIRLRDLTQNIKLNQFKKVSDNQWDIDYSAIPGHRYRIEIDVNGFDPLYAELTMPTLDDVPESVSGLGLPGSESGLPPDYFWYGYFFSAKTVPDVLLIQGMMLNEETGEYSMADLCTDYPEVDGVNLTGLAYGGNPKWRTVEYSNDVYYDTPLDGMEGTWTYMFPNLIGSELHKEFLMIYRTDDNHPGINRLYEFGAPYGEDPVRGFCISGTFYPHARYPLESSKEYFVFSVPTLDYAHFIKDAYQFKKVREGGDLSSIYLRDNMYSNIQGGLGIFGAVVSTKFPFCGILVEKE